MLHRKATSVITETKQYGAIFSFQHQLFYRMVLFCSSYISQLCFLYIVSVSKHTEMLSGKQRDFEVLNGKSQYIDGHGREGQR